MSQADHHTQIERAVFEEVLALHPSHLTPDELARKLGAKRDDEETEMVLHAIRDLEASGLLRVGDAVVPTYAALRCAFLFGLP